MINRWFTVIGVLALFGFSQTYAETYNSRFAFDAPTTLVEDAHYRAQRQGRFFVISLKTPHQVLSSSAVNGGQSTAIGYLVNHQSMEAQGDQLRYMQQITLDRQQYHRSIAEQLRIAPQAMALMGTAANVQHLVEIEKSFQGLTVRAFVTAGVRSNAQRAGDPTQWYQHNDGTKVINKRVSKSTIKAPTGLLVTPGPKTDNQGTINIILMINRELAPGVQTKIALLATEAKSAALAELAVSSKSSSFLATGTGTDQIIIASPIATQTPPLPSASGHLKLGELVGSAVRVALLEALSWQNRLQPSSAADLIYALDRFGLTQERLLQGLQAHLSLADFRLVQQNLSSILADSRVNAAAYAYAELLDRLQFGNLSPTAVPEILLDQAAQVAVAVSAKPLSWPKFWQALSEIDDFKQPIEPIDLFIAGLAQGWQAKWTD